MPVYIVLLVFILTPLTLVQPVRADAHFGLSVAPKLALDPELDARQGPPELTLRDLEIRQRRGRWLIVSGVALTMAGVTHTALMGGICGKGDGMRRSAMVRGASIGAGIAFMIGGGIKLDRVPDAFRRDRSPQGARLAGLVLGTLATFALAQGALFGLSLGDFRSCIAS